MNMLSAKYFDRLIERDVINLTLIDYWVSGTHWGTPSSKRVRTATLLNARGDCRCFVDGILRQYLQATFKFYTAALQRPGWELMSHMHRKNNRSTRDLKHDGIQGLLRQSCSRFDLLTCRPSNRHSQTTGLQFHTDMATPHMDLTDVYAAASWEQIITSFWFSKKHVIMPEHAGSASCNLHQDHYTLPGAKWCLGWDWHPCCNHHSVVPPREAQARHTGI